MNNEFEIPDTFFAPAPLGDPVGIATASEPWPSRLPFDVAMGVDGVEDLELRYNLTADQLHYLLTNQLFLKSVQAHRDEITTNGVGFKHKAKVQAETYLAELDNIIADKTNSPAVRLDAIKSVVKYAGLEPANTPATQGNSQSTKLIIQWGDNASTQMAIEMKNESGEDA